MNGVEVKIVAPRQNEGGGDWKATLKIEERKMPDLLRMMTDGGSLMVATSQDSPVADTEQEPLHIRALRAYHDLGDLINEMEKIIAEYERPRYMTVPDQFNVNLGMAMEGDVPDEYPMPEQGLSDDELFGTRPDTAEGE